MVSEIAMVVWPVYFVLAMAFVAGKTSSFPPEAAAHFNKLALKFALPAMLFISMAGIPRLTLGQQWPALATTTISYLGMYFLTFSLIHWGFKRTAPEAAIAGLCGASPMAALLGPAILPGLFGPTGIIAVSVAALVLNILQNPAAFALVGEKAKRNSSVDSSKGTAGKVFSAVFGNFREPVVIAPVLGVILVLAGIPIPKVLGAGFKFIGSTSAAIAVFAVGLLLASVKLHITKEVVIECGLKMLGLPAVVMGVGLLFGLRGTLLSETVVTSAFSSAVMATMLASREGIYIEEATSSVMVTSLGLIVTLPFWIYISKLVGSL